MPSVGVRSEFGAAEDFAHLHCGQGPVDCIHFLRCQFYVGRAGVFFQACEMAGAWNGDYPGLFTQHPREGYL